MLKYLLTAIPLVLVVSAASPGFGADRPVAVEAGHGAKIYGDAGRGAGIVTMWCSSCHSTGSIGRDTAPSLAALAANPSRTDGAIRAFLMHPHDPMPPLELGGQQIEDIIAYLHSLRPDLAPSR